MKIERKVESKTKIAPDVRKSNVLLKIARSTLGRIARSVLGLRVEGGGE